MNTKLVRIAPEKWPAPSTRNAILIVKRLFRGYESGVEVRFWDGNFVSLGPQPAPLTLVFRDPGSFREVVLSRDPLRLAQAHFGGLVEIEGSIYEALRLKNHFLTLRLSLAEKMAVLARALRVRGPRDMTGTSIEARGKRGADVRLPVFPQLRRSDRSAAEFRDDLANEFYGLWLDEQMVYSCAYFETPEESLDQAQRNKFEHLCRKLRLRPGETLLDIGCGWGGFLRWAARHYGVSAHGITLSRRQYEYASRRIHEDGLDDKVRLELRDYRDMPTSDQYDKIVSVGMVEQVGIRNLAGYFRAACRLLKPGGLFLNHGVTVERSGDYRRLAAAFAHRRLFPNGALESVGNVLRSMECAGFEILDVESLRPHYALTLRHWVKRLEKHHQEALEQVGEATYRIWRLYLAACALQFEAGEMNVYQILLARRGKGFNAVPLTRRDIYPVRRRMSV